MAKKNTTEIGFEKEIWKAADLLRGNLDASEYKSVVLGLIFLKYISDRFDDKYNQLVEEGDGFEEDKDEYTAEKFSELLNRALSNYLKGLLTNEEVIQELLDLAKEIATNEAQANELGLTPEEKAFYDALTKPQAVKDVYTNEQLVEMTKELTDQLRKNRTIDWQKKESARAGMRRMIKRLLKKYHYPPEEAANALETVIRQCEQWTDNDAPAADPQVPAIPRRPISTPYVLSHEENPDDRLAAEDFNIQ